MTAPAIDGDWIGPDWDIPGVAALSTTRRGGVSRPPFDSLNLGDHVGDAPAAVASNREALGRYLPAGCSIQWLNQVHGTRVIPAGEGGGTVAADASFSRRPGVACAVMTADCLPVLFAARDGRAVAAAHAGWRGLQAGVLEATAAAMGVAPAQLLAWLGPAIGPLAFEVGAEVRAAFLAEDSPAVDCFQPSPARPGAYLADLYALARRRLAALGVAEVCGGGLCTYSDADKFFSYRRDGQTGRMASLIWLTQ